MYDTIKMVLWAVILFNIGFFLGVVWFGIFRR